MKKILLLVTIIILLVHNLNSQNIENKEIDAFIGEYSIKVEDEHKSVFVIVKNDKKIYLNDLKNDNSELIELKNFNKSELKSDLYKKLPKDSQVIGNISSFIMCQVPENWSYEGFVCDSGYFIVTIIGPVNVYKN